jgi:hypothetical protein
VKLIVVDATVLMTNAQAPTATAIDVALTLPTAMPNL